LEGKIKIDMNKKLIRGMSLLEILIVVAVFSILGVIITRSVLLTLRGSRKSESQVKVRENVNYALGVIERQLRNADSITTCPNVDTSIIDYKDERGTSTSFSCVDIGGSDPYIASGSARLTSDEIIVTTCNFTCVAATSSNPPSNYVSVVASDPNAVGIEGSQVTTSTKVYLRTY
jgi:prepilin-type N-terminal cleavage/methylation domain-containing protein